MSQWVRSKYDENAKKWKVCDESNTSYLTTDGFYLPVSEYLPCDPPERWQVCTREVVGCSRESLKFHAGAYFGDPGPGFRWAWSMKDPDGLVIERQMP